MSCSEIARNCDAILTRGMARMEREWKLSKEARDAMKDAIKKTPVNLSKNPSYRDRYLPPDTKEKRGRGRIPDGAIVKLHEAISLGFNLTKSANHAGCVPSTARRYIKWIREGKL